MTIFLKFAKVWTVRRRVLGRMVRDFDFLMNIGYHRADPSLSLAGSDYYTLPMLQTPDGQVLGDTFDIALYLDETYPTSGAGRLFPDNLKGTGLDYETPCPPIAHVPVTTNEGKPHPEYARFNWHVDTTFTSHVILVAYYMPFKSDTK